MPRPSAGFALGVAKVGNQDIKSVKVRAIRLGLAINWLTLG